MAIPTDVQDALDRLDGGYNNADYNASTNALGFSAGGHRINLYALTEDVVLVGGWLADEAATVSGLETEITALAAITAQITVLAAIDDEIIALAAIAAAISALAAIASAISTVAANIADVSAVAAIDAAVTTVAGIAADVPSLAAIDAEIVSLNGIKTALQALALITAAISTVAGIEDDVVTLAAIAAAVTAVAAISSDVETVAANISHIQGAISAAATAVEARNETEALRDQAAGYAAAARAVGLFFGFSDVISDGDPGAGLFRLDNADPALATKMFISTTAVGGGDATSWIDGWDDSTTLDRRGEITLIGALDAEAWAKFQVIDTNEAATGYRKVQIALIGSSDALVDGNEYGVTFSSTGNAGAGDGDVTGTDVSVAGHAAVFVDEFGKQLEDGGPIALSGVIEIKTENYIIIAADRGKTLIADRATAIQFSIEAAANLAATFTVVIQNKGVGPLTIDPDGGEQIAGASTLVLISGQSCVVSRDGSAFQVVLRSASLDELHRNGADIASAATVNLETATGSFVEVTGTVTTTAITLSDGHERLVRAGGVWPLTHGTNLQIQGGASYTCAAGDLILFVSDGAVVRATIFPVSGQPVTRVNAKSENYTVLATDIGKLINVDASAAARTITLLPAATAGNGFKLIVKKTDSSSNTVTVDGNGAETIDGATTKVLRMQHQPVALICDGTAWHTTGVGTIFEPANFEVVA